MKVLSRSYLPDLRWQSATISHENFTSNGAASERSKKLSKEVDQKVCEQAS